jgi:hypothetical protein
MISRAVWVQGSFAASNSSAAGDVLTLAGFATLPACHGGGRWANSIPSKTVFSPLSCTFFSRAATFNNGYIEELIWQAARDACLGRGVVRFKKDERNGQK